MKNLTQIILTELMPVIIKQIAHGKTKLGVYLLGIFGVSMGYFFGDETKQIVPAILKTFEELPPVFQTAGIIGAGILSTGIGHDLIKRAKTSTKILKSIRSRFKNPF